MRLEAESYASSAHQMMQKYRDKKWYQFWDGIRMCCLGLSTFSHLNSATKKYEKWKKKYIATATTSCWGWTKTKYTHTKKIGILLTHGLWSAMCDISDWSRRGRSALSGCHFVVCTEKKKFINPPFPTPHSFVDWNSCHVRSAGRFIVSPPPRPSSLFSHIYCFDSSTGHGFSPSPLPSYPPQVLEHPALDPAFLV